MLFGLKDKKTIWVWTSADREWSTIKNEERKLDDCLFRLSALQTVKVTEKKYLTKQWNDMSFTDYVFVKVTYPMDLHERILDIFRMAYSVSLQGEKPRFLA